MIVIILLRFRNDVSLKLNTLSAMFLNFFYPFQIVSKSTVGPSTGILRGCHGIQSRYLEEYPGFFLPNPGKNEYSTVKRFRSISLTSFILKTLEGLVDHFIRHDILIHRPLHRRQHAYPVGQSKETALQSLVGYMEAKETVTIYLRI